jgi:hypothetical protein
MFNTACNHYLLLLSKNATHLHRIDSFDCVLGAYDLIPQSVFGEAQKVVKVAEHVHKCVSSNHCVRLATYLESSNASLTY